MRAAAELECCGLVVVSSASLWLGAEEEERGMCPCLLAVLV